MNECIRKFIIQLTQVRPASPDDDQKMDVMTRKLIKLYLCSDESGSLHIKEVKGGPLEQSDLDSNDAFIIDNGQLGIWVWIGKKATRQERAEAMRNAQGFIKKKGRCVLKFLKLLLS